MEISLYIIYFASTGCTTENEDSIIFSVLDQQERFHNFKGAFHLKVCYPELTHSSIGSSHTTIHTIYERQVTGPNLIRIAFPATSWFNCVWWCCEQGVGYVWLLFDEPFPEQIRNFKNRNIENKIEFRIQRPGISNSNQTAVTKVKTESFNISKNCVWQLAYFAYAYGVGGWIVFVK